ncbi:MAG: hypothetical protein ACYC46_07045 [Acidobacteriaceae bacterium]
MISLFCYEGYDNRCKSNEKDNGSQGHCENLKFTIAVSDSWKEGDEADNQQQHSDH